jgi:XRE family aerobic/anaerobic benzoate catabolism transcriptional regulator
LSGKSLVPGDLLGAIGASVRSARESRDATRADLAARSGLSVRFLAQLEAGEANISILRLNEVTQALGISLQELLASCQPHGEAARAPAPDGVRHEIQSLLRQRSPEELLEARDWLAARFAAASGPLVALLGLRGAGKSSVGRKLAKQLHVPFYELDVLIEKAAGLRLQQIFDLQGEAYYRRLERETLARFLATTPAAVLATGGGVVNDPETYALLRRRCRTIWLRARPEMHWERVVHQGDQRPMQGNPDAMIELRALLAAREPLYSQADLTIDTSGRAVTEVAAEVARALDPRASAKRRS